MQIAKITTKDGLITSINIDSISYIDGIENGSRIVMADGTVFILRTNHQETLTLLGFGEQKIEFDPKEVHTKNKKGSNKHGKTNKNS